MTPADDLIGECLPRTLEHRDFCVANFDLPYLWDDYGIVGDVVVCYDHALM